MKISVKYIKLKLLSPIAAKSEAPYENPWDGGEDYRIMTEPEKKKCIDEIRNAVCGLFRAKYSLADEFDSGSEVCRKVLSAAPSVEEINGRLMLVLNCKCSGTLSESELDELCEWWEDQVIDAHEQLKDKGVKTAKFRRIFVYIWFINGWSIEPVFVCSQADDTQDMEIGG